MKKFKIEKYLAAVHTHTQTFSLIITVGLDV